MIKRSSFLPALLGMTTLFSRQRPSPSYTKPEGNPPKRTKGFKKIKNKRKSAQASRKKNRR